MGERRHGDRIAALHVVDAGAIGAVTVKAPGQFRRQRADGMDGVDMAEQENAGTFGLAGDAADQDVGIAHRAGDALDPGVDVAQEGLGMVGHAVDGSHVLSRALDGHPSADGLEKCGGGQVLHVRLVRCFTWRATVSGGRRRPGKTGRP